MATNSLITHEKHNKSRSGFQNCTQTHESNTVILGNLNSKSPLISPRNQDKNSDDDIFAEEQLDQADILEEIELLKLKFGEGSVEKALKARKVKLTAFDLYNNTSSKNGHQGATFSNSGNRSTSCVERNQNEDFDNQVEVLTSGIQSRISSEDVSLEMICGERRENQETSDLGKERRNEPESSSHNNLQNRTYLDAANGSHNVSGISNEAIKMSSWANVLSSNVADMELCYIPPTMVQGKPVIHVKSTELKVVNDRYSKLVVGSFVGKKQSYAYVKESVEKFWNTKEFSMDTQGDQMYTFKFDKEEKRKEVLEQGSFFISSHLFLIRPWRLFVEQDVKDLKTVPIWVLFENYPVELWDKQGFSRVGSAIGIPLFPDRHTANAKNSKFARLCIEIEAEECLPEEITVVLDQRKAFKLKPKYKWTSPRCSDCKVFGHGETYCPKQQNRGPKVWLQKNKDSVTGDLLQHNKKKVVENEIAQGSMDVGAGTIKDKHQSNAPTSVQTLHTNDKNANGCTVLERPLERSITEKEVNISTLNQGHISGSVTNTDPINDQEWITPTRKQTARRNQPQSDQYRAPLATAAESAHTTVQKGAGITPFKGLVPIGKAPNTTAIHLNDVIEMPKAKEVNPFEVKPGEHLSFEEELDRGRKAKAWAWEKTQQQQHTQGIQPSTKQME